jgi:hypothetical protein
MRTRFAPRDPKNYQRLQKLSADQAIQCYLEGGFSIGEETALIDAVHRGLNLTIDQDSVEDILADCMAAEVSVEECKSRLLGLLKA